MTATDRTAANVRVCRQCDWTMRVPRLAPGESAHCPRCAHAVWHDAPLRLRQLVAWGTAALVMLALSLYFPFIHLQAQGAQHSIVLLDVAAGLLTDRYAAVGLTVALCTVILPGIYLLALVYIGTGLLAGRHLPGMRPLAMLADAIRPWTMSDVFVFGVLISLIKVVTLAGITLGPAFATFCAYALALLVVLSRHQPERVWPRIAGPGPTAAAVRPGRTASAQQHAGCPVCGAVFRLSEHDDCVRCGHHAPAPPTRHQQTTWALIVTALLLFIPAMGFPAMSINQFGNADPQTIVGGAWHLVRSGSWPIAVVILLASVVVPIGKLLALAWLCLRVPASTGQRERMRLYRVTELIGRWSMIDVFVVALLVALVQAGQIMSIEPGPGIIAFAAVVIVTMLAAMSFDSRAIWLTAAESAASHT